MTVASVHTQACFNAWINCEDLLVNLAKAGTRLSKKVTKVIDECAFICMGTFHALKTSSVNTGRFAVLCVGICEECAELCEELEEEKFIECARICRFCSKTMSSLATNQDLND
jgi:hypothetical protein